MGGKSRNEREVDSVSCPPAPVIIIIIIRGGEDLGLQFRLGPGSGAWTGHSGRPHHCVGVEVGGGEREGGSHELTHDRSLCVA